ncbi:MAG: glucokinase [Chloroflexota bacterium]
MLLAGDIGGTKTDLALYTPAAGPRLPHAQAEFRSAGYPNLVTMVREFLGRVNLPVDRACFAVAGPVMAGQAKITNLPWLIDAATLAQDLHLGAVHLLNDLEAIAGAVPLLEPDDLHTLNAGTPVRGGTIAVIAPGTGLGEAFLTWDGTRYRAYASEGGHADFAPTDLLQVGLLQSLWDRNDHVSFEAVCSGLGIPHIYTYLRDRGSAPECPNVAAQLATATDPTPVIVEAALYPSTPSPLCAATLDTFVSILGAEAGNLALKVLATGGVYLAGGLPMRMIPLLDAGTFRQAFQRKGPFADLLAQLPIHVVVKRAALIGAARYAFALMLTDSEGGSHG